MSHQAWYFRVGPILITSGMGMNLNLSLKCSWSNALLVLTLSNLRFDLHDVSFHYTAFETDDQQSPGKISVLLIFQIFIIQCRKILKLSSSLYLRVHYLAIHHYQTWKSQSAAGSHVLSRTYHILTCSVPVDSYTPLSVY